MLYELLYEARTAARKKGLITSGKKVFVRFSKKYFIIRDEKKRSYNHPMPLYLQVFFPQKNGKESGSYGLGYIIAVLYFLKGPYDFQYTPNSLELTGSGFFIKLNSVEHCRHLYKKNLKDFSGNYREKTRLKAGLKRLEKELREL